MTDPIADMLTRIRNSLLIHESVVRIPFSNMKYTIAKILKNEGFIGSVERLDRDPRSFVVRIEYGKDSEAALRDLRRVSKPGRRVYASKESVPHVLNGQGIAIISTSSGIMTDKEARRRKVGGEVLCEVW